MKVSIDEFTVIDASRRFIPETLTPLFFTSAYGDLTTAQRLRYNQLHACYFCEQIIFFEQMLGCPVLIALAGIAPSNSLQNLIQSFFTEENAHSAMFRRLLRLSTPQLYQKSDFFFIRPDPFWAGVLACVARRPRLFPMLIWLQLLQEERAMHFSKCYLNDSGILEPEFLAAQKKHLSDEIDHIRWDHELLDWLWPSTSHWWRIVNAKLFCWMVQEFFYTPKRSGMRVVEHLVQGFPELYPMLPRLKKEMHGLSANPVYLRSLYSKKIAPHSYEQLGAYPEFSQLTTILPEFSHA